MPLAGEPGQMISVPDGLAPIEFIARRADPLGRAGVIVRRDGALALAGKPAGTEELRDRLALTLDGRYRPDHVYVLGDRDAPASAVAAVLAARPPS